MMIKIKIGSKLIAESLKQMPFLSALNLEP